MALGDRIRFIRKLRGMTQQELGEAVGFSKSTADVRIGQYETNVKKPRQEALQAIAKALDVSIDALIAPDLSNMNRIMHTLFLLEDELGFSIGKDPFHYYIELNPKHPMFAQMRALFELWYTAYAALLKKEIDLDTYNNWRYKYPLDFLPTEDDKYQQFLRAKTEHESWNLRCKAIQMLPEGLFEVGREYAGKVISASAPYKFRGQLFDEGFLVKDSFDEIFPFSLTDFSVYFKIQ